jgi:pyruvate kinase
MLRTKIVCTLGPASSDPSLLEALARTGMDVARINMSHGDRETHRATLRAVREAGRAVGRKVGILVDLQGPKIRVGKLREPRQLVPGSTIVFAPEGRERGDELPTTYEHLAHDIGEGDQVLLDDGLLEIVCTGTDGERATFEVIRGGLLSSNKGINIPSGTLSASSLTPKDLEDLDFALAEEADFVGLSFVRAPEDVIALKDRVRGRALVVAKIEMARAMGQVDAILETSDLAMVARGDLGVELPFEQVPLAQKRIIQLANYHARPVITATQMLESMIENPRPTRAEASDVANAVLDGTDAVMLSGETAVGKYPVQAVDALVRIIREIECSGALESGPRYLNMDDHTVPRSGATRREHAVAAATVDASRDLAAAGVLVITRSGFSARLVASHRPGVPIFAVTTDPATLGQLAAVWGVRPVLAEDVEISYESLTDFGRAVMREAGCGVAGDAILVTAGFPFHQSGTTNTMRVESL